MARVLMVFLLTAPFLALARSCPMPTLEQEYDDSFAVVRAEQRRSFAIGDYAFVLVAVKAVYKGEHHAWGLWTGSPYSSFRVEEGEDGIWLLRWTDWGLPFMTDCGYSGDPVGSGDGRVFQYVSSRSDPYPPKSVGPIVFFCFCVLFSALGGVGVLVRRRMKGGK